MATFIALGRFIPGRDPQGETTMFTKTTLALTIILGTASGALAAKIQHRTAPAQSGRVLTPRHQIPGNAYGSVSSGRRLSPGDTHDSLSGRRHLYTNPDRDFFGPNAGGKIYIY
jgi:hypothetical protein